MKFTCEKTNFVEALSGVQKAVAQKSAIAALEGVLIVASGNKLELCGYNSELGITTSIDATIFTEGKIVLNASLFADIVRKLPSDNVQVEVLDNLVTRVIGGKSAFELLGLDANDFPSLPTVDNSNFFELPVSVVKNMIKQTIFSVSDSDAKPIHTGSLFEIKDKTITLVSVDGFRLAMRSESIKEDLDLRFVVPGKTLREVLRLLPDNDETLKISAGMQHIVFYIGNYCVVSRLLEGEFLDYKATIPAEHKYKVCVSVQDFLDAIERVSILITDRLKSPVRCLFSSGNIHLSCTTTMGKASDEIACKSDLKEALEIAFNNKYMTDALKNSDCDEIEIYLNGPLNPIKIMPKGSNSFLFLVLPVRIKAE